jgi:hypothetical protein
MNTSEQLDQTWLDSSLCAMCRGSEKTIHQNRASNIKHQTECKLQLLHQIQWAHSPIPTPPKDPRPRRQIRGELHMIHKLEIVRAPLTTAPAGCVHPTATVSYLLAPKGKAAGSECTREEGDDSELGMLQER